MYTVLHAWEKAMLAYSLKITWRFLETSNFRSAGRLCFRGVPDVLCWLGLERFKEVLFVISGELSE